MASVPSLHDVFPPPEVSSTDLLEVLHERIRLHDDVVCWRVASQLTPLTLDGSLTVVDSLTRSLDRYGWVWDVSETDQPVPSVQLAFRSRGPAFSPRVRHLAVVTGTNVGLWSTLREWLPESGFHSLSVHRILDTAMERARR
ncbi:MAG: hypothetical protein AAGA48_19890 [Myxococcota bacterium]